MTGSLGYHFWCFLPCGGTAISHSCPLTDSRCFSDESGGELDTRSSALLGSQAAPPRKQMFALLPLPVFLQRTRSQLGSAVLQLLLLLGFGVRKPSVAVHRSHLLCEVISNLSEPRFPHLSNVGYNIHLVDNLAHRRYLEVGVFFSILAFFLSLPHLKALTQALT